jgi:hypothetical protein
MFTPFYAQRYEGDPDLKPITHSEIVWVVRMLYDLSRYFNSRYGRYGT